MAGKHKLLITPLNWGLGHVTRMIPIIKHCLNQGHQVILGSDGRALQLLQQEFPDLPYLELPSYRVHYHSKNMTWNVLQAAPSILKSIYTEHRMVQISIHRYKIDAILSDNRYGCWSKKIPCICITHQIAPKSPSRWHEGIIKFIIKRWLRRFTEVWIPDWAEYPGLAGDLSHSPSGLPVRFIGPLSRLKPCSAGSLVYQSLAILSGPEPQRTFLEQELRSQFDLMKGPVALVRGVSEGSTQKRVENGIDIYDFLPAHQLNDLICGSGFIVSRSGYSTIMDLVALGQKALLIPTPGQTEQEYLAELHANHPLFIMEKQGLVNLRQVASFKPGPTDGHRFDFDLYKPILQQFLNTL